MGFTHNRTLKLVFDDPSLEGLEVKTRSVPLKTALRLMHLSSAAEKGVGQIEEMLDVFAGALVAWNLEDDVLGDDGQPTGEKIPVPATREGLESQEIDFVMEIVLAWQDALMAVSGPLGKKSSAGARSLEASMPMETLSPNPLN